MILIKADYVMGIAMLLMLAAHSVTQFIAVYYSTYQREQQLSTSIMQTIEKNPIAAKVFELNKFKYWYSFFFAPSALIAFYYYLRRKWVDKNRDFLTAISISFLAFMFSNFLNDFSYLLGLLAR